MPGGITAETIYGTKSAISGAPINTAPSGKLVAQPSTDTQTTIVPVEQMPISSQPIANITQNLSNPASPIPQILIDKPSLLQTGAVGSSILSADQVARLKDLSAAASSGNHPDSFNDTADWRKWLLYILLAIAIIVLIVMAAKKKKK